MVNAIRTRPLPARNSLLFAAIVAAFCIWILSLPLFPSQDGPMHRYYVHVLAAVLNHDSHYQMYRIRHPFPPYATHYFSMLLLYKVFPYDLADKIFVCGLVVLFGYGFRFCAIAIGRFGDTLSLLVAPLFLHWAVLMGFFNYDLALALFLFAAGFWMQAVRGHRWCWAGYALSVLILAVTHPVPLLVLIGLCAVDLVLTFARPALPVAEGWVRRSGWRVAALGFACLCFLYPAASIDSSHSSATLHEIGLHRPFVTTTLLLTGVSPYNTRSTSLLVNSYRLSLYVLIVGALILAFRAFSADWRARNLTLGSSLFVATVLLGLGLPFLPDSVNGSYYFATRLVVLVWIGALLAASAYQPRGVSLRKVLIPVGIVFALVALITAEVYVRPVARTLRAVEQQPLPAGSTGLILVGKGLDSWSRFSTQLAPDFFEWGQVLPVVRQDDVTLDTPWLEQNILPLQAVDGAGLFVGDIHHSPFLNPGTTAPAAVPESELARSTEAATFVMYAGTPAELSLGLGSRLPHDAAFQCSQHEWYLLCLKPGRP